MFRFVQSSSTGIRQRFGKFVGICQPGLNFYIPVIETITPVSNMVFSEEIKCVVKTKDDVSAEMAICVQLQIKSEDTEKAFFRLLKPRSQIDSYVQNVVRSKASIMTLDHLFESQTDIAEMVSHHLEVKMSDYGYTIVDTLVNNIVPAKEVVDAMNKINASERLKRAAQNEADAHYIKEIRQAEADRDRKILQGEGISGQRLAILKGYESGVDHMAKSTGLSAREVIDFVARTQHMDMLEAIGRSQNAKTVFMSHTPDRTNSNFSESMMVANEKD